LSTLILRRGNPAQNAEESLKIACAKRRRGRREEEGVCYPGEKLGKMFAKCKNAN